MTAYYNEIDPYAAQWLRNLIDARLIPAGDVDERSIRDVAADDLRGYTQCHFFAGLGGWPHALRLAGWPDDRPVWTGSCPCQPFSLAGKLGGFDDERDLWPTWLRLIIKRRPPILFGEQVASAVEWLLRMHCNLEAVGYAVGAMPIEAASAGSYQLRDRFWFVARADQQFAGQGLQRSGQLCGPSGDPQNSVGVVAGGHGGLCIGRPEIAIRFPQGRNASDGVGSGDLQVAECADGKWRPIPPPGIRWLGNGIPARVAKLRAFGNAIDPNLAAEFIVAADAAIEAV